MGQLSFWSADARPRALGDLEGLLCGPGRAEIFGRGSAARLTVVLGPPPVPEEDDEEGDRDDGDDAAVEGPDPAPAAPTAAAEPGGPTEGPDTPIDPDELAFLDLDPEEIAARLGGRAAGPAHRDPAARAGEVPDTGRQWGVQAEEPDHAMSVGAGERGAGDCEQRAPVGGPEGDDPVTTWRARAVCCALRARGVPARIGRSADGRPQVHTAFRSDLVDLARAWTCGGGMKTVPAGFELDGPRLRLWVLAAGAHDGRAYTLGLDPEARTLDERLLTASRDLGLGARLVGDARVPVLRIVGARRQGRLGELVGCPPRDLAHGVWPV